MTTITTRRSRLAPAAALAALAILGGVSGCGSASSDGAHVAVAPAADHATNADKQTSSEVALRTTMRALWGQHMEWTYATVAAFAAGTDGLNATLDRLLTNQADIGNAVRPFYGDAAADQLTTLLKAHINGAVPILVAAKAGNTDDLQTAVTAWYANAKEIADFLAAANPAWGQADMEAMMKQHIDQTLTYATDQLQGHYAKSIDEYGAAEQHMMDMADMLTDGLVAQFPAKFRH
jgi:hypothetical protein